MVIFAHTPHVVNHKGRLAKLNVAAELSVHKVHRAKRAVGRLCQSVSAAVETPWIVARDAKVTQPEAQFYEWAPRLAVVEQHARHVPIIPSHPPNIKI